MQNLARLAQATPGRRPGREPHRAEGDPRCFRGVPGIRCTPWSKTAPRWWQGKSPALPAGDSQTAPCQVADSATRARHTASCPQGCDQGSGASRVKIGLLSSAPGPAARSTARRSTIAAVTLLLHAPFSTNRATPLLTALHARAADSGHPHRQAARFATSSRCAAHPQELQPRRTARRRPWLSCKSRLAGLTTAARYRMVLLRQEARGRSRVLGSLDGIALSADGYLHCYLDAARLIQGDYELRLEPDSGVPSSTTAFAFALRAPITAAFH